jgi:hypothetical protein
MTLTSQTSASSTVESRYLAYVLHSQYTILDIDLSEDLNVGGEDEYSSALEDLF